MSPISLILAGILLITGCSAIIYDRPCRGVSMVMDFDLHKYARSWYEVSRYETSPQWNGDCSTFDYEMDHTVEDPDELQVTHRFAFRNNGTVVERLGTLSQRMDHLRHGSNVGHLMLSFDDMPGATINYCLIASDYENYAVVWSCENLEDGRSNGKWAKNTCVYKMFKILPFLQRMPGSCPRRAFWMSSMILPSRRQLKLNWMPPSWHPLIRDQVVRLSLIPRELPLPCTLNPLILTNKLIFLKKILSSCCIKIKVKIWRIPMKTVYY